MGRSVDDVIHSAFNKSHYDPAQRHERYLRSRQLKGRQSGGQQLTGGGGQGSAPPGLSAHVNRTAILQSQSNARQVAVIKGKLGVLKKHLAELLAKKKASSSSDSKSSDSKSSKSGDGQKSTNNQPKTAAQKAAAKKSLEKAQKERAKQAKATPDKKPDMTLDEQISHTRAVIADVETKLHVAIEQARNQTASNGR
jgi:hypothetical protein